MTPQTMPGFVPATPDIRCMDYWPHGIPKNKLRAYKVMLDAGQITKPHVLINQKTGSMNVSYASTIPHEWIRQEMGRIAEEGSQIQMEVAV